jgi:hypothetical protein
MLTESCMQKDEEEDQEGDGWMTCPWTGEDGCKRMERESKEPKSLEAYCTGEQGPHSTVVLSAGGFEQIKELLLSTGTLQI